MPRTPNTQERRQQIVDGLRQVIATSGYAGATIAAIAKAAGLAPGLIHYHFRDKREILVALVQALAGYARERYARRAAAATDAAERLRAYVDARLAYGADAQPDAVAAWVMIGEQAVQDADVREVYQSAIGDEMQLVRRLLKACYAERGKRVHQLDHLVAAVMAFVEGAFVLATNARPLLPAGFAAPMALAWIERYIDAEPDRPGPGAGTKKRAATKAKSR